MMTLRAAKQAFLLLYFSAASAAAQAPAPPAAGLPAIARELEKLSALEPAKVYQAVLSGLEACLAEEAKPRLAREPVKKVIVELYLLRFDLASREMTEHERRQNIEAAAEDARAKLSNPGREDLQVLMDQGLDQGLTLLCVAASARGLLTSDGGG